MRTILRDMGFVKESNLKYCNMHLPESYFKFDSGCMLVVLELFQNLGRHQVQRMVKGAAALVSST